MGNGIQSAILENVIESGPEKFLDCRDSSVNECRGTNNLELLTKCGVIRPITHGPRTSDMTDIGLVESTLVSSSGDCG